MSQLSMRRPGLATPGEASDPFRRLPFPSTPPRPRRNCHSSSSSFRSEPLTYHKRRPRLRRKPCRLRPPTSGVAMRLPERLARPALALWGDTNGLMAPYVAVMLPVLVGFALLALDASRRMSLQTQMQAAADSLALAGARELNKQPGAESRAISAMANAHAATKSSNTLFGSGSSPTLDYTFVFYSGLSAAS